MKNEDYKKLNDYLNDTFVYLSEYDGFFLSDMCAILNLNIMLYEKLKDIDLNHNFHENNLTFEDIFNIARNEIEKINPNYLDKFDKLITSGRLEFFNQDEDIIINEKYDYQKLSQLENSEEDIRYDSVCSYIDDDYFVDLVRKYNYEDVFILIHEFIHSTNASKTMGEYRYILTEFFSIYFEMYAQKNLLESGTNSSEFDIFARIKDTGLLSKEMFKYTPIIIYYNLFGNINENSYDDLIKYNIASSTKEEFESTCFNLLNYFDYKNKEYNNENKDFDLYEYREYISSMFSSSYRYLLGTLFSCYLLENGNKDKVVWLNNHINDDEIKNMDFISVLKIIDIDLTSENINKKLVECAQKYYENLSKYSVKETKEKSLTYKI